jgi:tRNA modification GTPase
LLDSSEKGKVLKDGIKIVICGKPNVGKSLLLNVLLKTPRAIVSDIAGTTRDTIEETAQIQGIPLQLVDTAGILEPRDLIEKEAVKRSRLYMQSADLILFILDANTGISKEDKNLAANIENQNMLVAVNKCDLKSRVEDKDINVLIPDKQIIRISALKETGIDQLEKAIVDHVLHGQDINTHGILISNMRHIQSLKTCLEAVLKAVELMNKGLSLEFVSEEIKMAVSSLDAITGRDMNIDILDQIFANFCIGK